MNPVRPETWVVGRESQGLPNVVIARFLKLGDSSLGTAGRRRVLKNLGIMLRERSWRSLDMSQSFIVTFWRILDISESLIVTLWRSFNILRGKLSGEARYFRIFRVIVFASAKQRSDTGHTTAYRSVTNIQPAESKLTAYTVPALIERHTAGISLSESRLL